MAAKKTELAREQCIVPHGNEAGMALPEAKKFLADLHEGWSINSVGHLERVFLLKNFVDSLGLAVKLGEVAETSGHHPDLLISYGQLRAEIWSHQINGLSRADFVLAAKIDEAAEALLGNVNV